ncbi:DNA double-strand break repair nuclease NurA [Senegalia massiliensis]|uniref:NurA domain-containing protein n=1 Tax=Senegalia massiliensis TaxID=1720316 RepID=A0A845R244_9CLOT|nr:DNA double-strand break repair nuclease NurA [Senegalia massiliensis]NBI07618.1 hypothetical protein [Senegalia massiliensis]
MNSSLITKINNINSFLRNKENNKIDKSELRKLLNSKIGNFITTDKHMQINRYKDNGILSVDGSINNEGATFPYLITLLRAYAHNTKRDNLGCIEEVEEVFCPVYKSDRDKLDNLINDMEEGNYSMESIFHSYIKNRLAELELISAMEGIKRFNNKIVLLDGGFKRFEYNCPTLLDEFKEFCLENNVTAVGIIEEVSTHTISKLLKDSLTENYIKDYDRELLFGVLNINEWLKVDLDIEIKIGYYTTFARFSQHPQIISIDFLKEQVDVVDEVMSLLSSLTPLKSRGIPIPIDIVDKEVRITDNETSILMGELDLDIKEKFIVANHNRRQF